MGSYLGTLQTSPCLGFVCVTPEESFPGNHDQPQDHEGGPSQCSCRDLLLEDKKGQEDGYNHATLVDEGHGGNLTFLDGLVVKYP